MDNVEKIFRLLIELGESKKNISDVNIELEVMRLRVDTVTEVIRLLNNEISSETIQSLTQLDKATLTVATSKKKLTDEEKEANKIAKLQKDVNDAEEGSLKQLNAQIKLNSFEYSKMSKEKREGTEVGKLLGKELKAQREEVRELTMATGDNTRNIGNYKDALGPLPAILTKVTAGIGIATALIQAAKPIIDSTQTSGDAFAITVGGMESALGNLQKAIASSDFSLFINNAKEAIKYGRELVAVLDEAGDRSRSIRWRRAEQAEELEILRESLQNSNLANSERIKSGQEYVDKIKALNNEETQVYQDTFEAQAKAIASKIRLDESEIPVVAERLKAFVKEYNANKDLITQTQAYNRALEERKQYTEKGAYGIPQEVIDRTNKTLASASDEVKKYSSTVREYQLTSDKELEDLTKAAEQYYNAQAQTSRETRRIVTTIHGLEKTDTDKKNADAKKGAEHAKTLSKEQLKIASDNSANVLAQQTALRDAEIALMQEGVEKKLAASAQAALKQQQAQDKEYAEQLTKIKEQQEKLNPKSKGHTDLEAQKTDLTTNYEAIKTANTEIEGRKRIAILQGYSIEELTIYERTLTDHRAKGEAQSVLTEKQLKKELDAEIAKELKVADAYAKTQQDIINAENQYATQKRIIEETANTDTKEGRRKLKEETIKNELELRQAKANTYIAELNSLQALGLVDTERYNEILAKLIKIKEEAENIGKGKEPDGEDNRSFWEKLFDLSDEDIEKLKAAAFDLASQINNAIADAEKKSVDRRLQQENKRIDDEAKSSKKVLDDKRKRGLISEKTYQKELEKVDAEAEKRRTEADKKAFEDKKRIDTKAAIINTALGIGKAIATAPTIVQGFIMASIAAATGAVQIATIQSQKYALGGVIPVGESGDGITMGQVKGPSHAQGGLRIMIGGKPVGEMEGDEIFAIINKNSSNRYLPQLSKINQAGGGVKFAAGGIISAPTLRNIPMPASVPNYRQEYERLNNEKFDVMIQNSNAKMEQAIERFNDRVDNIKVYVVESDISDAQKSVANIKKAAIF